MHRRSDVKLGFNVPPNPFARANFISKYTFWWTINIFKLGYKRDIDEFDLPAPLKAHTSSILGDKLAKMWAEEVKHAQERKKYPNLKKVIAKCFYKEILLLGVMLGITELFIRMHLPFLIGLIIRYFLHENKVNKNPEGPPRYLERIYYYSSDNQCAVSSSEAVVYAVCMVLILITTVFVLHPYMFLIMHTGMKMRVGCCSLIYRKALRISYKILNGDTIGQIVNLMSNDVNRFDVAPLFFHYIWIGPVQALVATILMYPIVENAALVGMSIVILILPLQMYMGVQSKRYRARTALRTDARVREMNEIVQGIHVIKMYTWEDAFAKKIHDLRRAECTQLKKSNYIRGFMMSSIMFVTRAATGVTILYHILVDKAPIQVEEVVVIICFYQIIRQSMTVYFPQGIGQIAESLVSISRIKKFLLLEETDIDHGQVKYEPFSKGKAPPTNEKGIFVYNASAEFETDGVKETCLKGINLEVKPKQLTAIIGEVGAGKSSLLNLLLRELSPTEGTVTIRGSVSFAAQEPWLFAASVRQNILFGSEYNRSKYRQVCSICSLNRDFKILPYADKTSIGDRGISLSGGQRARISLARAVYMEADIYLLDDPLSAVDPNVGNSLFFDCIVNYLREKTVVLVTHQLQYIQHVQQVVIMEGGRILGSGSYAQLKTSGLNFAKLLAEQRPIDDDFDFKLKSVKSEQLKKNTMSIIERPDSGMSQCAEDPDIVREMRSAGKVDCKVYLGYFWAAGKCYAIFVLSLFLLSQITATGVDVFLISWTKKDTENRSEILKNISDEAIVVIYAFLLVFVCFIAVIRSMCFYNFCIRASIRLHNKMFESVCKATMYFYDTNDSGRILNRFSKDLGAVDEILPNTIIDFFQIMLNLIAACILVCSIFPYMIIPTAIICLAFYLIRRYYLSTSRSVKRLDGITRSPVFGHVTATLAGLTTVRAHKAELQLIEEFDKLQDVHSGAWFIFIGSSRAFGFLTDLLCAIYIGIITICLVLVDASGQGGADVGLIITQIIGLMGLFQWGMRQSAELENNMTAVERILEFTNLPQEKNLEDPDHKPPPNWPMTGRVEFKHLYLSYGPSKSPTLKDINFTVLPQEKVGIIGRTGAGKSSLIAALFQLARCEGQIIIDGIDVSSIGLHDLRRKISIIPQEPVIFSGSLRYNLDPFNEYGDKVLFQSLHVVEYKIEGKDPLNQELHEGGINLSTGQKQLICLARAVVKNNLILVLDEATANIDQQTDKFIQKTIRNKFSGCTVLTIAHRLHTIMDYDKIVVMDAGMNVEMDHPYISLQNPNGFFSKMVERTGASMAPLLHEIAKKSYEKQQAYLAVAKAEADLSNEDAEQRDRVDNLVEKNKRETDISNEYEEEDSDDEEYSDANSGPPRNANA